MLNRAVLVHVASLLVLWPSQKIREEIICVEYPTHPRIIVLIRKDVFLKWNIPAQGGPRGGAEGGCTDEPLPSIRRIKSVTGVRG
jgi:hypothetical protein